MKLITIFGGLVSLSMVAALAVPMASARQTTEQQAGATKEDMRDRLQTAVESLDSLSAEQQVKVKDIFADAKTQRQTIMNDSSLSEDQKKAKMKELHQATKAKVNSVLTPEQQTALKSKMEAAKANAPNQP